MRPLAETDRKALYAWGVTRLGVLVAAVLVAAVVQHTQGPFVGRWAQWDVNHFATIARYGYGGLPGDPDPGLPAFFPGMPLLLRAVHYIVPNWTLAGMLISLVAGAVAMVALARLGGRAGPLAVIALLLSPYTVFLFAGYSESLFLAFALPAWLYARRRDWRWACLCAAGATCVRVTGLFLAAALIVEFVTARGGLRWKAAWLIVPFLPAVAYSIYQWRRTGDWLAWQHAQAAGWGRKLVDPWQALTTTWHAAFGTHNQFTGAFRAELVAAAVGVGLTLWLLYRRRWAESTYVGLQMIALLCSAFYLSIGRATLLWWPLWLAIGGLGLRRPVTYVAVVAVTGGLAVTEISLFTSGAWSG